jgi:ribulose-phosphate 3-epimerase
MSIARDGKKGDLLKVNNSKIIIAPSILAADLSNLCYEVKRAEEGDADMIHLDVIDGHFAPNITFGADTIKALRKCTTLDFDAHLMIAEPLKYVERFINAGEIN